MSDRDYYEILGLTPTADGAMVDQAYWHLARKYQGLAATNPRAQQMLDELNEAYGVLGTPRLREQYDAFRDDVLIRKGMVQPVKARPHAAARRAEANAEEAQAAARPRLPALSIPHARTYAVAAIIAALAFAGAWQGVNIAFVIATLGVGLTLALAPTVGARLSSLQLSMPAMPQVAMPQIQAPRLSIPSLPDIQVPQLPSVTAPQREEALDPEELHASTAATIARWRASVGLRTLAADAADGSGGTERATAPVDATLVDTTLVDTTLVDIVESERGLETESEPLNAVLEILRGSHRSGDIRR